MEQLDIARQRLVNQDVATPTRRSPADVVRALGAVQAQDLGHAQWAVGLRTAGATAAEVEDALRRGAILRTWVGRGTLHLIPSEDAKWMLALAARRTLERVTPRIWQYHATDERMMSLAASTFAQALSGGRLLTRGHMTAELARVGIRNDRQQAYFILGYLSQQGLLCPGPPRDGEQTFALLEEWAPAQRDLDGEQALGELAGRFFSSHGPATVADFANWSGVSNAEAKAGLELVKSGLACERVGEVTYWGPSSPGSGVAGSYLLPAYDEFVIGYKDRSASFSAYGPTPIATYNGMFYATMVRDGQVMGLWKRRLVKDAVHVDLHPSVPVEAAEFEPHARRLGEFLGRQVRVTVRGRLDVATERPASWRRERRGSEMA